MKFLFDTNAVIAIFKGNASVIGRMTNYAPTDFGLPAVVLHELFYGAYKSQQSAANVARVEALQFEVLPFDAEDAQHTGDIRAALAMAGTPIGPYDAMIAGQARARNITLITHNVREFCRVDGLTVEDWQTA